ncbi:hypothetical protein FHS88_003066 [Roseomonas alkaliterrae]|uniref:Uncharacterized protein n=2 Tax=Neoroseomonas alkaliterrae TaxID=1452450 RepID=A0A840YA94_9PROT|nr:hypothetical protein [Neoroseomonas alkaliterrae]MBB5690923.1 hypothetical protein [Neoroseomonas alkaliterrae]
MIRLAPLIVLLAACAGADPAPAPRPAPGAGAEAALRSACEAEAERAVNFRERGQDARLDRELGQTDQTNTIPSLRVQSDAFQRRQLREELIRDCIRANTAGPRPQDRRAPARRSGA